MTDILTIMRTSAVIPVLVIDDATTARPLAEALVAGGLRVLEVTMRTPAALEVMREMASVPGAVVGAGLAFLWFNAPPAAVFMGDTGSLALGGALGTIAVVSHHEIVLGIIGGLFVAEALSVIIQVFFYKRTGKRVFRMAPIHHHFEQLGWSEPTVVIRFWIVSLVLALAGLATLKIR